MFQTLVIKVSGVILSVAGGLAVGKVRARPGLPGVPCLWGGLVVLEPR